MRPRLPIRRILFLRPFRPPNCLLHRPLTRQTTSISSLGRPQLPFLSPSRKRPFARFLTTETKKWIKSELILASKITIVLWSGTIALFIVVFGVQQEWLNHKFPSPEEWSWWTRKDFRNVQWEADTLEEGTWRVDWGYVGSVYLRVVKRLEDPEIDGAGIREQDEGGILVAGVGKTGYDITDKSEPWRRGYYEVLMGLGKSAEHLDGWVMDTTTRTFFPANMVPGPQNPNPRPIPPGGAPAPRIEDCVTAYEAPETYYMRILTTKGFTDKQKLDAALAYATWLDFKETPSAAYEMYKWALDIATANTDPANLPYDSNFVLKADAGPPSANLLSAITALAVHQASNSNLSSALPILLSILRARRSLPETIQGSVFNSMPFEEPKERASIFENMTDFLKKVLIPPPYPPPPSDGTSPPRRSPKETCEEAGIMTYIGEILYASKSSKNSEEEGLAWTREAVDIAEEQLRSRKGDNLAKKVCAQCLKTGTGNWKIMVSKLADREKALKNEQKERKSGESWLGFGGRGAVQTGDEDVKGRWESEEMVLVERVRRTQELLESVKPVKQSFLG